MKKCILLISVFAIFSACKREYDPSQFGPEVIVVPENFTVNGFTINPSTSVDLSTQDVYFGCTMSQRAEFKLIITGLLSGARKTISGTDESINSSNSNWTGDVDSLYMFRAGEKCLVELSFHGAKQKYYDTITVLGENVYPKTTLINNVEGISFDKTTTSTVTYGVYFESNNAMALSDIKSDSILKTCEGVQSVGFDGFDADKSYYIGGVYFHPDPANVPFVFTGYETDSLYYNVFIYSYGDKNTNITFAFEEDDNGDGVFDDIRKIDDDEWQYVLPVDWIGWKMVNIPMKNFTHESSHIGNGMFNFNKILSFNVNLGVIVPGTRAHANLDYLVISYGKPFKP